MIQYQLSLRPRRIPAWRYEQRRERGSEEGREARREHTLTIKMKDPVSMYFVLIYRIYHSYIMNIEKGERYNKHTQMTKGRGE